MAHLHYSELLHAMIAATHCTAIGALIDRFNRRSFVVLCVAQSYYSRDEPSIKEGYSGIVRSRASSIQFINLLNARMHRLASPRTASRRTQIDQAQQCFTSEPKPWEPL
jgi:hypothetical protein